MRKIVLGVAVSLDGFIEGPNGEYDWCFTDQDYGMTEFMSRIDTLVMGRKSFELVQRQEGPNPWSHMQAYVVSNTLREVPEGYVLLSGDISSDVRQLRVQPGKDIWLFGGAQLTSYFIQHDLIDEYWLSVHPIVLGSGKPLFENIGQRKKLVLLEEKTYSTGLVSLRYRPTDD